MKRSPNALLQGVQLALLFLLPFPAAAQVGDVPADPWFTGQDEQSPETADESSERTVSLSAKSPKALQRELRKAYEQQSKGNLSKRISLLEEMIAVAPNESGDAKAELAELQRIRSAALDAIAAASERDSALEPAIEALSRFADYFASDPSLLLKLLDSDFARRLDASIESLGRQGDVAQLATIEAALARPAFNKIFGARYRDAINRSYGRIVEERWSWSLANNAALPGERYLVSQLLQNRSAKIALALEISDADPRLQRNIERSLQRRAGNAFEIATPHGPDVVLRIDASPIRQDLVAAEAEKESTIPDAVVEIENPEFVALVAKYEKAAKGYKMALETYEMDHQRWLESIDTSEYDNVQRDLKSATERVQNTPPTLATGQTNPEYADALQMQTIAQSLANSIEPVMLPEPVQPYPRHLGILEDLYLIPPTIITSSESTPYTYIERTLNYRFEAKATLELASIGGTSLAAATAPELVQERSWIQNVGASPRDPVVGKGTFSEDELNSTLDVFGLEFGALCARAFQQLTADFAEQSLRDGIAQGELGPVILALALRQAAEGSEPLTLDAAELRSLALAAQAEADGANGAIRRQCLRAALSHPRFASLGVPPSLIDAL